MDRSRKVKQMRVRELKGNAFPPFPMPGSRLGGRQRSPASRAGPQERSLTMQAPRLDSQPQGDKQTNGQYRKVTTARKSLGGVNVGP
eukprot:7320651-Heterocapsa_arctica.AAC.1